MAVIKATDAPVQLNSSIELPPDRYAIRCKKEEFGPSKSSGNMMVTRTWEIVHPEYVESGGQKIMVAGTELQQYLTIKVLNAGADNEKKTLEGVGRYLAENKKLNLPSESVDNDNPELHCEGVVADALLNSENNQRFKALTPEERAAGKKVGSPILGEDGKPVKTYRPRIDMILGLSSVSVNQPY